MNSLDKAFCSYTIDLVLFDFVNDLINYDTKCSQNHFFKRSKTTRIKLTGGGSQDLFPQFPIPCL